MELLRRLVYRKPGQYHNFLMHPFLLMTASYGVALTFFAHTAPVQQSILYSLTVLVLPKVVMSAWGIVALVVTVLNFVGVVVRNKTLGTTVAMLGFMLWFYAFFVYALSGFWVQVFFAAIPNLMFWGWYYYTIHDYHRENT